MKIGACGMACGVCGFYLEGVCAGCVAGTDEAAPQALEVFKGMGFACQVLDCAIKSQVGYCLKDCDRFPCEVHYRGFPYSPKLLNLFKGFAEKTKKGDKNSRSSQGRKA